ncbi:MAG: hypothetical protein HUU06_10720 [Planctomycetaceae bacterium]|nr:hypothetical protein [Planctomycetota bacterium]NUN53240.1 hypothetical protein [Planctomycetaceae bacterium]
MAPREIVDADRLRGLLEEIGRTFRKPARLFLTGGETMVWRGLRASTMDVHFAFEVEPAHHDAWLQCLRGLKERLSVSLEEAGPGDFIPLPPGWEGRARHAGKFGSVDVYLFDPWSIALARIERGHARDFADVRALIAADVLDPAELRRHFEAILPAYGTMSVKADPRRFRSRLESVLAAP